MNLKSVAFLSCCFIVQLPIAIFGQADDNQVWVNYALSAPINDSLRYGGDFGVRGFITDKDWYQAYIRPTINYTWNQTISTGGGMALFHTFGDKKSITEFRLHQDLNVSWPDFNVFSFFHRFRIEERWFTFPDLPNDFQLRVRYLVGIQSADIRTFGEQRPIFFQVSFEGLKTLEDKDNGLLVNSIRTYLSIGHKLSKKYRYEVHYIRQKSGMSSSSEATETNQNIFRLSLFYRVE